MNRGDGFIFAKLGVCFWRHKKFVRAGAEAAGYWAAALSYLREDESTDGVLENDVIGLLFGLGEREARKLCDRLVKVELFATHDRGYVLLGYATKNETKDEIAARRACIATRVANSRAKRRNGSGNGVHSHIGNSSGNALQGGSVTLCVPVSVSPSVSDSDLLSGERDPDGSTSQVRLSEPPTDSETGLRAAPRTFAEATDDGLSTLGVANWCAGIRSVTGASFFPEPTGPQRLTLVACLRSQLPAGAEAVAWAHGEGAAYARANAGGRLAAPWYAEWVGSGRTERGAKPLSRPVQPAGPNGERLWKVGGST
jgi:hypothetical protein